MTEALSVENVPAGKDHYDVIVRQYDRHLAAEEPLTGREIEAAILPALPPRLAQSYRDGASSLDASLQIKTLGRFRLNLHRERGRPAATIRALPARPPHLSELGLPSNIELLSRLPYGLVLIGGPVPPVFFCAKGRG